MTEVDGNDSDRKTRASESDGNGFNPGGQGGSGVNTKIYNWKEWEMMIPTEETSTIRVKGR